MASTVKSGSLKVTIKEEIYLKNKNQGATTELSISDINEVATRIVTAPTSEVTIISFSTAVAAGTYVESSVRYIRITNLDDTNYTTLNIEGDSSTDFSVRLDPGASHLIISSSTTGVVDYADISGATLEDLTGVKATANTAACDLEIFVASA